MVNDFLSDFVTRIRNGYQARLEQVSVLNSRQTRSLAKVLMESGYIKSITETDHQLTVNLKYSGNQPAISGIKRISKPGSRRYLPVKKIPRVWGGLGMNILSTPKGIISDKQAQKLNTGGELLAQVW